MKSLHDKFINDDSVIDCIRKISILGVGIILGLVYLVSYIKLYKLNNKRLLHIETIAVLCGFIKIICVLLEEFVINDEIFEFITITVYTIILAFVLYKFIKTFVESVQLHVHFPRLIWILRIFYLTMAAVLLANMIIGIVTDDYFICERLRYRYNWHVAIIINTVICYLNILNGFIIFRMRKKVDSADYFSISQRDKSRVKKQMMILIWGYASVSTLTLIWFIVIPYLLQGKDVSGTHNSRYWIPRTEFGGLAAIIKTYLLLAPTVLFWLGFFYYRVPFVQSQGIKIEDSRGSLNSSGSDNFKNKESQMFSNTFDDNSFSDADRSHLTTPIRKTAFNKQHHITQSFIKQEKLNQSEDI